MLPLVLIIPATMIMLKTPLWWIGGGLLTAMTLAGFIIVNPNFSKVLVLFGMLIPPFLTEDGSASLQILTLGGSFIAIAFLTDTAYALMAGRAREWLSRPRIRMVEIASGTFLAAAGIWMALKGR